MSKKLAPVGLGDGLDISDAVVNTTDGISAVRWSMRVVRQARDRAERRVDSLVRELASAKQKVAETGAREKSLRKTLDDLREENARISAELTSIKRENGQMRLKAKDLSSRSATLMDKLDSVRTGAAKERQNIEDTLSQKCRHLKSELERANETTDNLSAQLSVERGLQEDLKFNLDVSRKSQEELRQAVTELLESGQRTVSEIGEALFTSQDT